MYSIPFLDLPALDRAAGTVRLPGSKSISNRLLLLAGLAEGRTELVDLLDSDDTKVMLDALAALGCTIERTGRSTFITGMGAKPAVAEADLFLEIGRAHV
jgi:3-phosphoshikimate 1-carboxyvinyltransferase